MKDKTKRLILVSILVLGFFIMLIGNAKAEDLVKEPITKLTTYDSIKTYDSKTQTVTLINKTDLSKNVATLKLNTPINYQVGYGGVFKVAEFQVNSFIDVESALKEIEFYNMNNQMEKISRTYEYKVKGYEGVLVDDYQENCILLKNGTQSCENEVIGNHIEQKEIWIPLEKIGFSKGEVKTIGIFTYVYKGDKVEWIPTYYGVEIKEWASWVASLDTNLDAFLKLDETSGTIAYDEVASQDFDNSGVTVNQTGIINKSYYFGDNSDRINRSTITGLPKTPSQARSYGVWVYRTDSGNSYDNNIIALPEKSPGEFGISLNTNSSNHVVFMICKYGTACVQAVDNSILPLNTWTYLTATYDGTTGENGMKLYINGVNVANQTLSLTGMANSTGDNVLGYYGFGGTSSFIGRIDEVGIWSRELTQEEVINLYNSGLGCTYQSCTVAFPTIIINSPINYYNTTNPTITFNISVYDDFKIQNVSLYIDGVLNETNTSEFNGTYIFTKILSEDNHNWSILAYDNDSNPIQSEVRYFTIDSTPPIINVTMPPTNNYKFWTNYTDGIYDYFPYSSYFINWSTYDDNLDTCWFENISLAGVRANLTIPCNTNATIVYPVSTGNTLRFFANDSMGNNASVTRTSIYNDIRIDRSGHSYINYTTEGVPRTFWLSARIGVGAELENVNFVFDGVKYPLSTSGSNFSKTIIIPEVTTTKATTYYWEFDFGEGFFNSTIYNITIGNILLSPICNSTYPYYIFNVTLRDEKTQREINGTIETAISIYPLANSSINIYNWNSTQNTNRTYLCSNLPFNSTDIYKAEGTIKYYSDLGTITNYTAMNEYYSFLNFTLNNNSQFNNITLYDINTSEGTEFQLTFKDSSYRDRGNVLIYVYRQYLPENIFKIVEVPKTDSNGQTIVHLVRNDVIYNLIAVDSTGSILGILNNVNAFCNDYTMGDCKIEFQGTTSETELENYIDDLGFSYTLTFNETSSTINLEFLSDTNEDKNIRLVVISSAIVTNRTLCNTSLYAITGTLSCDVSSIINSSSSINVKIYLDEQEVINDYLSLDSSDWNVSGIIFFGFLFIILIGIMFIESKEGMIIGVIVGLIILVALGVVKGKVIGFTSGILWLIVAGIIILIKLNKENK